jgi:hypothetical protein
MCTRLKQIVLRRIAGVNGEKCRDKGSNSRASTRTRPSEESVMNIFAISFPRKRRSRSLRHLFLSPFLLARRKVTERRHPVNILIRHARSSSVHFRNSLHSRCRTRKRWPQARQPSGSDALHSRVALVSAGCRQSFEMFNPRTRSPAGNVRTGGLPPHPALSLGERVKCFGLANTSDPLYSSSGYCASSIRIPSGPWKYTRRFPVFSQVRIGLKNETPYSLSRATVCSMSLTEKAR